jgi:nucleoside-diphosphate-sugar epimerase
MVDTEKVRRILKFEAEIDLREGIRRTLEYYENKKKN